MDDIVLKSATLENTTLEMARALDPGYYTRPDVYSFEMQNIIATGWQVVATAQLLRGGGDVIARNLGDIPIIVVRTMSGELKGFYNICPHRAGPLAMCDAKGTKRLRCGYHGWAYDHDGRLKSAPEMDTAQDFKWQDIRLTPIDVHEWKGFIFARAVKDTDTRSGFDEVFEGLDTLIGDDFNGLIHHGAEVYEVEANWKIYVDNYLEGYHLPFVHPGLTEVVDYQDYKTELSKFWSVQRSPIDDDNGAYGAGEGLYVFIYPNTMLNILPGRVQTNRVVPTGLDRCQVEFDFYYTPDSLHRAQQDYAFSEHVQEEDRIICEHVQKGLKSGVYTPGRLSPSREAGVWHWQTLLREAYTRSKV